MGENKSEGRQFQLTAMQPTANALCVREKEINSPQLPQGSKKCLLQRNTALFHIFNFNKIFDLALLSV